MLFFFVLFFFGPHLCEPGQLPFQSIISKIIGVAADDYDALGYFKAKHIGSVPISKVRSDFIF